MKSLPLPLQILKWANKHDVLQLMVVEVAGSQRHDKVSETNQRWFHISKYAHNYMTTQNSHGCFAPGLKGEK